LHLGLEFSTGDEKVIEKLKGGLRAELLHTGDAGHDDTRKA